MRASGGGNFPALTKPKKLVRPIDNSGGLPALPAKMSRARTSASIEIPIIPGRTGFRWAFAVCGH
jgi:hypothetical protein